MSWRTLEADALEARCETREQLLTHLEDVLDDATRHGHEHEAAAIRHLAAALREQRNELASEARNLRIAHK